MTKSLSCLFTTTVVCLFTACQQLWLCHGETTVVGFNILLQHAEVITGVGTGRKIFCGSHQRSLFTQAVVLSSLRLKQNTKLLSFCRHNSRSCHRVPVKTDCTSVGRVLKCDGQFLTTRVRGELYTPSLCSRRQSAQQGSSSHNGFSEEDMSIFSSIKHLCMSSRQDRAKGKYCWTN